jgi:hypothetical protein
LNTLQVPRAVQEKLFDQTLSPEKINSLPLEELHSILLSCGLSDAPPARSVAEALHSLSSPDSLSISVDDSESTFDQTLVDALTQLGVPKDIQERLFAAGLALATVTQFADSARLLTCGLIEAPPASVVAQALMHFQPLPELDPSICITDSSKLKFRAGASLASGATAKVRLADLTDDRGTRPVVCKEYHESFIISSRQQIMREIDICQRINSPRFPRFEKVFMPSVHEITILMEPCDFSLDRYLKELGHSLPPIEKLRLFIEIAEGLEILHQNEILHRDVKPANILLKWEGGRYYVKLTDFGASRSMAAGAVPTFGAVGTAGYMAPELFAVQRYQLTSAIDIFAFAMTMLEILNPGYSFRTDPAAQIPANLRGHEHLIISHLNLKWTELITKSSPVWRPAIPVDDLSLAMAPLIQECWDAESKRRPSARMIRLFCESVKNNPHVIQPVDASSSTPADPLSKRL